jgi:hypothetical protein
MRPIARCARMLVEVRAAWCRPRNGTATR